MSDNIMRAGREPLIDYLKAICICFVIINHSNLLDKSAPFFLLTIDKAVPLFMLLSGMTFVLSLRGCTQYRKGKMLRKFFRFTIPTLITFVFWIVFKLICGTKFNFVSIVKLFILGKYGQGSYYWGLMIQFIMISPLLYWILKKV